MSFNQIAQHSLARLMDALDPIHSEGNKKVVNKSSVMNIKRAVILFGVYFLGILAIEQLFGETASGMLCIRLGIKALVLTAILEVWFSKHPDRAEKLKIR